LKVYILDNENGLQKWQKMTPAITAGLTDHIWSFKEFITKKYLSTTKGSLPDSLNLVYFSS
jgi:hypothetical protein